MYVVNTAGKLTVWKGHSGGYEFHQAMIWADPTTAVKNTSHFVTHIGLHFSHYLQGMQQSILPRMLLSVNFGSANTLVKQLLESRVLRPRKTILSIIRQPASMR